MQSYPFVPVMLCWRLIDWLFVHASWSFVSGLRRGQTVWDFRAGIVHLILCSLHWEQSFVVAVVYGQQASSCCRCSGRTPLIIYTHYYCLITDAAIGGLLVWLIDALNTYQFVYSTEYVTWRFNMYVKSRWHHDLQSSLFPSVSSQLQMCRTIIWRYPLCTCHCDLCDNRRQPLDSMYHTLLFTHYCSPSSSKRLTIWGILG